MQSPEDKAKEMIASYWAIITEVNKTSLLSWMNHKDKNLVAYGVPLVAKQCALYHVDDIIASYEEGAGELLHWQKVKQALISM